MRSWAASRVAATGSETQRPAGAQEGRVAGRRNGDPSPSLEPSSGECKHRAHRVSALAAAMAQRVHVGRHGLAPGRRSASRRPSEASAPGPSWASEHPDCDGLHDPLEAAVGVEPFRIGQVGADTRSLGILPVARVAGSTPRLAVEDAVPQRDLLRLPPSPTSRRGRAARLRAVSRGRGVGGRRGRGGSGIGGRRRGGGSGGGGRCPPRRSSRGRRRRRPPRRRRDEPDRCFERCSVRTHGMGAHGLTSAGCLRPALGGPEPRYRGRTLPSVTKATFPTPSSAAATGGTPGCRCATMRSPGQV